MLFLDVYLLSGADELCIMQGKGNILYTNKFHINSEKKGWHFHDSEDTWLHHKRN